MDCNQRVAVVVLNYNTWKETLACVDSVLMSHEQPHCVIVVDNASANDSTARIRSWLLAVADKEERPDLPKIVILEAEDPAPPDENTEGIPVVVLQNKRNGGYSAGNNIGIIKGLALGADAVWLLNNDTKVAPEALAALRRRLFAAPRPGLCGGMVVYPNGLVQCRGGGYTSPLTGLSTMNGSGLTVDQALENDEETVEARINFIYGACVMASRNFVEVVGLMDERFFLYCEEQDWAWSAGGRFNFGYARDALVTHMEGQSTGWSARRFNARRLLNLTKSRLLLFRKHRPAALPIVLCAIGFAAIRILYRRCRRAGFSLVNSLSAL